MSIPTETRVKAKKLFVVDGKKQFDISRMIGISERTIAGWSSKERWVKCRVEYLQAREGIENNLMKIYEGLTEKTAKSLDPQDVQAVLQFEKILSKKKGGA